MEKPFDSPCASCSIGQYCCSYLKNLKLTKSEYKRHFAQHQRKLEVRQEGSIYIVSAKQGQTVSCWSNKCLIYNDRPIECRLYPYTIGVVWIWHARILITFHSRRTGCPHKQLLLISRDEARELISSFARDAFGDQYIVRIRHETLIYRLVIKGRKFIMQIISQLSRTTTKESGVKK